MTLRARLVHELRLFFVALQFLTRLPIPGWVGHQPAWLNRCVRHFPMVGALVGAFGALVLIVASRWWPPLVAAILAVLATVWLTGAFHEDGLADTFDALGGVVSRERALAIMKDSRIGTYGAAALALMLVLRIGLLSTLVQHGLAHASLALIGANVIARGCAVVLTALLPYAGDADHAKAKPLATSVPRRGAIVAGIVTVAVTALLASSGDANASWRWGIAGACAVGVVVAMRGWLGRRLGGYTGDTLGAAEQLAEVSVLLVLAAA
jgi:adenosylcobinamide-GDP ribazoletransferase